MGKYPFLGDFPAFLTLADGFGFDDAADSAQEGYHWRKYVVGMLVEWPAATASAPAIASPPKSKAAAEVVKWISENEATFAAQWKKEAFEPFEFAAKGLRTNFLAVVDKAIATNSQAGKLDDALAWKSEKARLEGGQQPHEAQDDPKDPAALKQLREAWKKSFDSLLEKAQTGYTQRQRFEDALAAKAKREEIAKAWLSPAVNLSSLFCPGGAQRCTQSTAAAWRSDGAAVETCDEWRSRGRASSAMALPAQSPFLLHHP